MDFEIPMMATYLPTKSVDTMSNPRQRLERKVYNDDPLDEDEIDGRRMFDIYEKLESDVYNAEFVQEMNGEDVNVKYLQENGFKNPLLVKDKTGLGIRVPSENFTVEEVKKCVGSRRIIDVLDVSTQKAMEMSMKDWVKYYTAELSKRTRLLNVLSLECSHSRLENYVEQPEIVKQIDWVDTVWPRYLKDKQTETTNILEKMYYPKVQRYCLMSVEGCYTDFHIDMGGTSVWYHILHGAKIFWLIPPTEKNLRLYEDWVLSGKQGDEFFADKVEKCQKIRLEPGWTFLIPTGWIHGVFTPIDSLVFGGNYIHSFNISLQLRIWDIENRTHVPMKFRYPFFTEMHWYVLERYVHTLTGKSHRQKSGEELKEELETLKSEQQPLSPMTPSTHIDSTEDEKSNDSTTIDSMSYPQSPLMSEHNYNAMNNRKNVSVRFDNGISNNNYYDSYKGSGVRNVGVKVHLTRYELEGISNVIAFLQNLATTKRFVPKDILDPESLLEDSKIMLIEHQTDDPEFAVTGEFTLRWAPRKKDKKPKVYTTTFQQARKRPRPKGQPKERGGARKLRRRVRCRRCEPCTRADCQVCHFCRDMKKFGGPQVMKQCCLSRQCITPVLPKNAACIICQCERSLNPAQMILESEIDPCIMECGFCYEIVHPFCLRQANPGLEAEGIENEDLPNSWECSKCVSEGKSATTTGWKKEYPRGPGQKRLVIGGRALSTDSEASVKQEGRCTDTPPPMDVKNEEEPLTGQEPVLSPSSLSSLSDAGDMEAMEQTHRAEVDLTSVSISPTSSFSMKLTNGHIQLDGMRQVSVQIERLKHIDDLSPTNSVDGMREVSVQIERLKHIDHMSPISGKTCSPTRKPVTSPSSPISSLTFYSSKATSPTSTRFTNTTPTKHSPAKSNTQPQRPLYRTRSADSSSPTKEDASSGLEQQPQPPRKRWFMRSDSQQSDSSQEDPITTPTNKRRNPPSGRNTPTIRSGSRSNTPSGRSDQSEGEMSQGSGSSTPLRRSSRRTRDGEEEEYGPSKKAKKEDHTTPNQKPATVKPAASTTPNNARSPRSIVVMSPSDNELSPVDGDEPKQAGRGSNQSKSTSQRSSGQNTSSSSNSTANQPGGGSNRQGGMGAGGGGGSGGEPPPGNGKGGGDWRAGDNREVDEDENNKDDLEEDAGNTEQKAATANTSTSSASKKREASNTKIPDLKPCKVLVHKYVIRPAPIPPPPKHVKTLLGENHPLDHPGWAAVFARLDQHDLVSCLRVCKTFYRWVMDPSLWAEINLNNVKITQAHLIGVVKRQPQRLDLSHTNIRHNQLEWLIARLPHLRHLNLSGNSWAAVSALCSSYCPLLARLDLAWVSGVHDACLRDLLSPPTDRRPGTDNATSRFHNCTEVSLTGSDITDAALSTLKHNAPKMEVLGLSCCVKITDSGIEILSQMGMVRDLDVSKCRGLTPGMFEYLKKMAGNALLRRVRIVACEAISERDIVTFAEDVGGRYLPQEGAVVIGEKTADRAEVKSEVSGMDGIEHS